MIGRRPGPWRVDGIDTARRGPGQHVDREPPEPRRAATPPTAAPPAAASTCRACARSRYRSAWHSPKRRTPHRAPLLIAESLFATLECELLDRRRFMSQVEARMAVFEFIEGWYNPRRRHSALEYESPISYERKHLSDAAA